MDWGQATVFFLRKFHLILMLCIWSCFLLSFLSWRYYYGAPRCTIGINQYLLDLVWLAQFLQFLERLSISSEDFQVKGKVMVLKEAAHHIVFNSIYQSYYCYNAKVFEDGWALSHRQYSTDLDEFQQIVYNEQDTWYPGNTI